MNGRTESPDRSNSELLVDLHILVVPRELWRDSLRSAANEVKVECISAGFIRFSPETTMFDLRDEIEQQLDDDIVPKKYVFLRSVGSRFTRLKSKQEFSMKAKYFAEPLAKSSELYLLESSADFLPSGGSSDRSSQATFRRYNGNSPAHGLPQISNQRSRAHDSVHESAYSSVDAKNAARRGGSSNIGSPRTNVQPENVHQTKHSEKPGMHSQPSDEYLPPLSATPPHTPDPKHHSANNSHDSGIHEPSLEELEKRRLEEMLRRQQEEEERRQRELEEEERQRRAAEEAERRRREIEEAEMRRKREMEEEAERRRREQEEAERKRRWEEEERKRREEEKQRWEEERRREEEERRKEEEMRRAEEERQRQLEEEERLRREMEDAARYPSPPALDKTEDKEHLLRELSLARAERHEIEKRREELVRKAKQLQTNAAHRRNQARDIWKKKYFEEKKKTSPLEEQCNKLRQELEQLHRKLVTQLEGSKESGRRTPRPGGASQQNNQRVAATKLQHEIEDLARRVENVKMKLTAEMKLRNQAETELRALRAELTQKKINVTLTRSQQMNVLGSSQDMYRPFTPLISPRNG